MSDRGEGWGRREFLGGMTLAGAAGLLGVPAQVAAEPPPETTKITMIQIPGLCPAPQYLVEDLLKAEGWTDVRYTPLADMTAGSEALMTGAVDVTMHFVGSLVAHVDAGHPVVILAGIHVGCIELFGTERVRAVRELKGKTLAVPDVGPTGAQYIFISSLLKYIGLDPRDVHWEVHPPAEGRRLFAEGKVDAYLGWPPEPQDLKARKIGHVLVNTAVDLPWAHYFCCLLAGHREFVREHPVATKRVLRAFLKATDMCAREPDRVAQFLVDKGYTRSREHAVAALRHDIPYDKWRTHDPEDTIRFYALRMREAGMITSSPQKIIAQGTDWRFLNELKRELKG